PASAELLNRHLTQKEAQLHKGKSRSLEERIQLECPPATLLERLSSVPNETLSQRLKGISTTSRKGKSRKQSLPPALLLRLQAPVLPSSLRCTNYTAITNSSKNQTSVASLASRLGHEPLNIPTQIRQPMPPLQTPIDHIPLGQHQLENSATMIPNRVTVNAKVTELIPEVSTKTPTISYGMQSIDAEEVQEVIQTPEMTAVMKTPAQTIQTVTKKRKRNPSN
ncbi:hypothetical protein H0H87_006036, partial [Tephrocybe sp. NHM501043]